MLVLTLWLHALFVFADRMGVTGASYQIVTKNVIIHLPWQRSTYSGRFLRAVCTTSKFPLPIQYMNVGRKSAARLRQRHHHYVVKGKWKLISPHFFNNWLFVFPYSFQFQHSVWSGFGNLPRIVLDAAQGQTEGHVPAQLFRGSHESLQIVLQAVTQGGDWHVDMLTGATLDLLCLLFMTYNEVLDDLWTPPRLLIHLCQHFQHIYRGQGGATLYCSFWYGFKCKIAVSQLPSTASPLDIFFRYIVMSAALSETEADMLTRGREPVDMSSNREQKQSWSEVGVWRKEHELKKIHFLDFWV